VLPDHLVSAGPQLPLRKDFRLQQVPRCFHLVGSK
jgi:hypothetical protein